MKSKDEIVRSLLSKKHTRIALCERSFFIFCLYYFSDAFTYRSAKFQKQYCNKMQWWFNILFNGFRECAKTVLAKYFIIRSIVYRKRRYIVFFCDESKKAVDKVTDIAAQLQINHRLIRDFGQLYHEQKSDKSTSKRRGDFEVNSEMKVQAMGMGETLRGKVYGVPNVGEFRPDLIIFDDIDTDNSVNTETLIEKNYHYVKWQVFGWKADNAQIIFLYNTIKEDGCWPRLWKDHEDDPLWHCMSVPLIDPSLEPDTITRPERYSLDDIMKKKSQSWDIAFAQNYLLIPYVWWQSIIKQEWINIVDAPDKYERIQIWVDPAISTKTSSDAFGIAIAWRANNKRYIIKTLALYGVDKVRGMEVVLSRYKDYQANITNVESVAFQAMLVDEMREKGMSVNAINTHRDKVTRLMEREAAFKRGEIVFLEWNQEATKQLTNFPNARYDDLVDAVLFAIQDAPVLFIW